MPVEIDGCKYYPSDKHYEDWQIPEYEERLKRAKTLKEKINNPPDDILQKDWVELGERYNNLMDEKTRFYQGLMFWANSNEPSLKFLELTNSGKKVLVIWTGEKSEVGNPKYRYFDSPFQMAIFPITTSAFVPTREIPKKEFVYRLMGEELPAD